MNYKVAPFVNRLINFIIDTLFILLMFFFLLIYLPWILQFVPFDFELDVNLLLFFMYIGYYIIFECFNGRTLGKLMTKTKVISQNGKKANTFQVLLRTLVRLFFIEIFSFFAKQPLGWHDRFSDTIVIKTN